MANKLKTVYWFSQLINKTSSTASSTIYFKRPYSANPPPPQKSNSFLSKIVNNFREEIENNKKIKQNMKEFNNEIKNLEKSEALLEARRKYQIIEAETAEGTKKAKQKYEDLKKKVVTEAQKTEFIKKAGLATEKATEKAQKVGHTIAQKSEEFSKTQTYKKISVTAKIVKKEIDESTFGIGSRVYRPPVELRKRIDRDVDAEAKIIAANTEAQSIVVHKDSKFTESWENFKNNNAYVTKMMHWRSKLDESDNPVVRATFIVKEKTQEIFSGFFEGTQMSQTLTEICKMDSNFNKDKFLLECEYFIIPMILESSIRPDLEVLRDWCHEGVFNQLAAPIKQSIQLGLTFDAKVLDINNVDLVAAELTQEGPMLAISFQSQQISSIKNNKMEVVEGDPNKVLRVHNVWVLCRDQSELNPQTAWRLMAMSAHSTEQLI